MKSNTKKVDWENHCEKLLETGYSCSGYNFKNCTFYADGTVTDIKDVLCVKMFLYDRGNGKKTAYLHYVDGVEIWDTNPKLWKGWKLGYRLNAE